MSGPTKLFIFLQCSLLIFSLSVSGRKISSESLMAMMCQDCNAIACPTLDVNLCPGGITWDECRCCETCAKTLGEECGGPYGAYGKCGLGMTCLKDSRECPYLFDPHRPYSNPDVCKKYLFNAVGRCVQEHRLRIRGLGQGK